MNASLDVLLRRQIRLERELLVWRLLLVLVGAGVMLAAAQPQFEKELCFASADGENVVTLSSEGPTLHGNGKPVARLTFVTVGDGDRQVASLKLNGEVSVEPGGIISGRLVWQ